MSTAAQSARYRAKKKKAKARMLDYLIATYGDTPCLDCNGTFPWCAMDFDHRPGETKDLRIGSNGHLNRTKKNIARFEKEIDKCDLVCGNCHRVRTQERGR
jgi:hypothetical protein